MKKGKRHIWGLLTIALLSIGMVANGDNVSAVTKEQAEAALSSGVYNKMSDNEYVLEGGGTISGKELFNKEDSSSNGVQYTINEDQLKGLESKVVQEYLKKAQAAFTTLSSIIFKSFIVLALFSGSFDIYRYIKRRCWRKNKNSSSPLKV